MIDQKSRYHYKLERLQKAQALGYDTISEAIIETYRKTKSAMRTGELNLISDAAVLQFLRKWGEPRIYEKTRGAQARVL